MLFRLFDRQLEETRGVKIYRDNLVAETEATQRSPRHVTREAANDFPSRREVENRQDKIPRYAISVV